MSFEGQVAIVTGGARGIGFAIAKRFLKMSATVHIIDKASDPAVETLGGSCFFYEGDIADSRFVSSVIKQIHEQAGRIDILVNNAGIIRDNVIWKMSEAEFDDVVQVNLKGSWLMCRELAPLLREQKNGRIINIVSRAWLGNPGQSNYSSSKGGLVSLTRVLALELASRNITVNAVAPGLIETPMTKSLPDAVYEKLLKRQPSGKAGQVEDIASAVTFLASDEAGFINGQVLHVDGGRSIGSTVF